MTLIDELIERGYLKTPEIIGAFRKIKREDFVLPQDRGYSEINSPLPIGYGQTISQPLTVAFMLELLQPQPGQKILDIGAGSGWTSALLAELAGSDGRIFGIERLPELCRFATDNTSHYGFAASGQIEIICGDGGRGLPDRAPFDRILVSAASSDIPEDLPRQLGSGGRLVIPVGPIGESQDIVLITKDKSGTITEERHPGFVFVPLV